MRYFMKVLGLGVLCIALWIHGPYSAKTVSADMDYATYYKNIIESDVWQSEIDHSVRVEMLQLPEEMIEAMDTDTLADAVLAYPFLGDIYAFDSIEDGVNILFGSFNGLRALEQREEAAGILLKKYKEFEVLAVSEAEAMDSAAVGDELFALSNLEVLMAQNFVTQGLEMRGGVNLARKRRENTGRRKYVEDMGVL